MPILLRNFFTFCIGNKLQIVSYRLIRSYTSFFLFIQTSKTEAFLSCIYFSAIICRSAYCYFRIRSFRLVQTFYLIPFETGLTHLHSSTSIIKLPWSCRLPRWWQNEYNNFIHNIWSWKRKIYQFLLSASKLSPCACNFKILSAIYSDNTAWNCKFLF